MVWNALHNGSGGLDWAGLPYVAAWAGVTDLDTLTQQLLVIKTHRRPDADDAPDASDDTDTPDPHPDD